MIAHAAPGYAPYLMAAGVAFAVIRRVRSHFGRQPWRPARTMVRIVLVSVILALLGVAAAMKPAENWGVAVGIVGGAALAFVALRLTRFHVDGVPGYTPNPWIGGALSALLVGRLVWRFASGGYAVPQSSSPLTLSIAAMVMAFYLVQGIGLTVHMKRLVPTAPPAA